MGVPFTMVMVRTQGTARQCATRALSSTAAPPRIVAFAKGAPILVHEPLALESYAAASGPSTFAVGNDLTGLRVWDAAPRLIAHLDRHRERLLHNRIVIELGCGTGAVGLAAAAFGARHVVLSDVASTATMSNDSGGWSARSTLAVLHDNVALNGERAASASVAELHWGCEPHLAAVLECWPKRFDTLVASDVLYYKPEETYDDLARTIRALAADEARVVLSYVERHGREHTFVERLLADSAFARVELEDSASEARRIASEAGAVELVELVRV